MADKLRVGIVADDITGANDVGAMLARNGYVCTVISLAENPVPGDFEGSDALVINTGSRLDTPEMAAEKSARAAAFLRRMGCDRFSAKTCSVFRGNIGASLDAVQDAVGADCTMVVLGFPANGRTTLHGVHYVRGVPLERTAFAADPVNPMHLSRLRDILAQQSKRPSAEFPYEWLELPLEKQQILLEELKARARYILFDVRDDNDLQLIARLIGGERSIAGASAIFGALPRVWGCAATPVPCPLHPSVPGTLIVSGSLTPQTRAQTAVLREHGIPCARLDPVLLLEENCDTLYDRLTEKLTAHLSAGQSVLLCADQDSCRVADAAARRGIDSRTMGRRITSALALLAGRACQAGGVRRVLVAGGETSDCVSAALGVRSMRIWEELEPGIPLMTGRTRDGGELLLVFKSGSFGSDGFLLEAMRRMNQA